MWEWVAFILFCISLGFVFMFGAGSTGLIGKLHYFLTDGIIDLVQAWGPRLLGHTIYSYLARAIDYAFNQRNPIFQLLYLGIITGAVGVYFATIHHTIPWSKLSSFHEFGIPCTIILCYYSFFACSLSDPGRITPNNVAAHEALFPYDGNLYQPKKCSTCSTSRPARSKHCRTCGHCVSKFDHHCIWMNACIGLINLRFFIMFLFMHVVICYYGTYLMIVRLLLYVEETQLMRAYYTTADGAHVPITTSVAVQHLFNVLPIPCALAVFLIVFGTMLGMFWAQHMWNVWNNWTTNETMKFQDVSYTATDPDFLQHLEEWKAHNSQTRKQKKQEIWSEDNPLRDADASEVKELEKFLAGGYKSVFRYPSVWARFKEVWFPRTVLQQAKAQKTRAKIN